MRSSSDGPKMWAVIVFLIFVSHSLSRPQLLLSSLYLPRLPLLLFCSSFKIPVIQYPTPPFVSTIAHRGLRQHYTAKNFRPIDAGSSVMGYQPQKNITCLFRTTGIGHIAVVHKKPEDCSKPAWFMQVSLYLTRLPSNPRTKHSKQVLCLEPASPTWFFCQKEGWQRSLEHMPAGTNVLHHCDMVTLAALLSQHIPKTVTYTSVKAEFMIPVLRPPFFPYPQLLSLSLSLL